MPQDHGQRIAGIEQAAEKFRGFERDRKKAPEGGAVAGQDHGGSAEDQKGGEESCQLRFSFFILLHSIYLRL